MKSEEYKRGYNAGYQAALKDMALMRAGCNERRERRKREPYKVLWG